MRTLDLTSLQEVAEKLIAENNYSDIGDFADDFSPFIEPTLIKYFEKLIAQDGVPEDYEGYEIQLDHHGTAEVLLCHLEGGRFYPSVSSPWWEAKISSVDVSDPSLGTKDPAEALAMGLDDLLCNLFGASIEDDE